MSPHHYGNPRSNTSFYLARLYGYARRVAPSLRSITLEHILSGTTCSPIGLADFELYLTHVEYTLENLQFIVWYQDYRQRFFDLPLEFRAQLPECSRMDNPHADGEGPRRVRSEKRRVRTTSFAEGTPSISSSLWSDKSTFVGTGSTLYSGKQRATSLPVDLVPVSPFAITQQPFRAECSRVVATFLQPDGEKELSLDADTRDAVLRNLTFSTHPDVFAPAYEEIYYTMSVVSLPRFLAIATTNINLPKQLFWSTMGVLFVLAALSLLFVLTFTVAVPPHKNRLYRLPIIVAACCAGMTFAATARGFCIKVGARERRQVRPWELDDPPSKHADRWYNNIFTPPRMVGEEEEVRGGDAVPMEDRSVTMWQAEVDVLPTGEVATADRKSTEGRTLLLASHRGSALVADPSPVAPFVMLPDYQVGDGQESVTGYNYPPLYPPSPRNMLPDFALSAQVSQGSFRTPPTFAPEKVVLDPRMKAAHAAIIREVYMVGAISTILSAALVLPLPSGV